MTAHFRRRASFRCSFFPLSPTSAQPTKLTGRASPNAWVDKRSPPDLNGNGRFRANPEIAFWTDGGSCRIRRTLWRIELRRTKGIGSSGRRIAEEGRRSNRAGGKPRPPKPERADIARWRSYSAGALWSIKDGRACHQISLNHRAPCSTN